MTTDRDHLINVNNTLLFIRNNDLLSMNKLMTLFSEQHTYIQFSQ